MQTFTLTALLLLGLAPCVVAVPLPTDLNLHIPSPQSQAIIPAPTPLIWDYRRAEIEALAVNAIRNGVEPEFTRTVIIRAEVVKSPTRTYKYSELDRLVNAIYTTAQSKAGNSVIAGGLK